MTAQQQTDLRRAHAASLAAQAKAKRENAAAAAQKARLSEAAPELLKALIYLRDCADSGAWPSGERWAQVQSAIKQATGGTK